ncbi:MAG: TIGR03790 family protein [Pseudomonadota bacterium]
MIIFKNIGMGLIWFAVLSVFIPREGLALVPEEVLVVANRNASNSIGLGRYYMEKRGIPAQHLLSLWVTDKEYCSYGEYRDKIALPVRQYLKEKKTGQNIRCLVMMYGLPLKVSAPQLTEMEKAERDALKSKREQLGIELEKTKTVSGQSAGEIKKQISTIDQQLQQARFQQNKGAAVDSEMALVLAGDYSLSGWLPNPFYLGRPKETLSVEKAAVLMVSRLDGPSDIIVRRIIDDSIAAEEEGLNGICYMDARWPAQEKDKKDPGYGFYDRSIHRAGNLIREHGVMPTVIEVTGSLFQPGNCPTAALYCGWYSLARYVAAFQWQRGAVGYHIASGECATLKGGDSQVWCKRMLEEGVAATIGPVDEPYVQAFPVPEIFFGYLTEGYLSLAECYFLSLPYLSWKMVLVGDPLYRPFKKRAQSPRF